MSLMIAVLSCQRDLPLHNEIRSTWGKVAKSLKIDVRFFVGAAFQKYEADETHLRCQDDLAGLSRKTREVCKWATGKKIDYLFFCHTNTVVDPHKLLASDFLGYDYAGIFDQPIGKPFPYTFKDSDGVEQRIARCYPWADGGYGYFLSRQAFHEVAGEHPTMDQADMWVGQVLGPLEAQGKIMALNVSKKYSTHKGK